MLCVVMTNVVMLNVIMSIVTAPIGQSTQVKDQACFLQTFSTEVNDLFQ
jgi:hypothetical protein